MLLCSSECPVWASGDSASCNEQCTAELKLRSVLRNVFQHDHFLPGQLEAVLPAVHGKDVFVRMRTGGGKSLCMFLVPLAVSDSAMGIIISPLIGLMEQQVSSLNSSWGTATGWQL